MAYCAPTIRGLIDLAIGTPDPGHVNFIALHCVLTALAERLNIADEPVDEKFSSTYSVFQQAFSDFYSDSSARTKGGGASTDIEGEENLTGASDKTDKANTPAPASEAAEAAPTAPTAPAAPAEPTAPPAPPPPPAAETPATEKTSEPGTADVSEKAAPESADESKPVEDATKPADQPTEQDETAKPAEPTEEAAAAAAAAATVAPTEQEPTAKPDAKPADARDDLELSDETISTNLQDETEASLSQEGEFSGDDDDESIRSSYSQHLDTESYIDEDISGEFSETGSMVFQMPQPFQFLDRDFIKIYTNIISMRNQTEIIADLIKLLFTIGIKRVQSPLLIKEFKVVYRKLRKALRDSALVEKSQEYGGLKPGMDIHEDYEDADYASSSLVSRGSSDEDSDEIDFFDPTTLTPERFAEQWYKMKTNICNLTNKVNTLSALFLKFEKERPEILVRELIVEMTEIKTKVNDMINLQVETNIKMIEEYTTMHNIVIEMRALLDKKVDKDEFIILMAEKVNYDQLKRKVSTDTMLEMRCCIEKRLNELNNLITTKELNIMHRMDLMQEDLGLRAVEKILDEFKTYVNEQIEDVKKIIREYLESTNEECAAAGGRFKVLQGLACVSCDTPCVMRSMEHKVGKMPFMHAKKTAAPLISYELSNIRRAGIPNNFNDGTAATAWLLRETEPRTAQCYRRAGGPITVTSIKERIEKVLHAPKIEDCD
ncbi:formin-like protein 4 [Teleopsis dalmanni]|uniref:formin-like protein 4 n=1 Tax=Teleopsis dalmanni TaxID=139649 RepID=UPI0018CD0946|nr:formin-like protein 4 [Teleopsis dalmanni]